MITIAFSNWNPTLKPTVELMYQMLSLISVPESNGNDQMQDIEYNLNLIQPVVLDLRSVVELHEFKLEKEEIQFFKNFNSLLSSSSQKEQNFFADHLGEKVIEKMDTLDET